MHSVTTMRSDEPRVSRHAVVVGDGGRAVAPQRLADRGSIVAMMRPGWCLLALLTLTLALQALGLGGRSQPPRKLLTSVNLRAAAHMHVVLPPDLVGMFSMVFD